MTTTYTPPELIVTVCFTIGDAEIETLGSYDASSGALMYLTINGRQVPSPDVARFVDRATWDFIGYLRGAEYDDACDAAEQDAASTWCDAQHDMRMVN